MDRPHYYEIMNGEGKYDYEHYIGAQTLFAAQKEFDSFCNHDELLFQSVHQIVELWMRTISYTLLEIDEALHHEHTHRVLNLFRRVHLMQTAMIEHLALLDTISPKSYQEIRVQLGNGSVRESPNYRAMLRMHQPIWRSFKATYLEHHSRTLSEVYHGDERLSDTYAIAEAFTKYDELFQRFRFHHIQMIHRTIGPSATSLKGNPVEALNDGLRSKLFPELWEVRSGMTDEWNERYGDVRPSLAYADKPTIVSAV